MIDLAEQGYFDILVHGCNCQNTMGSGIAKELRTRYPEVYSADSEAHSWNYSRANNPIELLGNFSSVYVKSGFTIVNAYTQVHYLPRGVDHFEYESFYIILKKLAKLYPGKRFGVPYIGMGLAGGDKTRIIKMIIEFANDVSDAGGSVTLVEFSG